MKRMRTLILLCAFACPNFVYAQPSNILKPAVEIGTPLDRNIAVIAHRGCWQDGAPEVSISAIKACELIKPDVIEVDVRSTVDGALILIHDETVDRTTNGTGVVSAMTFNQIRALMLKEKDGGPTARLTDETIPTLREALETIHKDTVLHLHIYTDALSEVAKTVSDLQMGHRVTTWVSGNNSKELAASPLFGAMGLIPILTNCDADLNQECVANKKRDLSAIQRLRPSGYYVIPKSGITSVHGREFLENVASANSGTKSRTMVSTLFNLDKLPLSELEKEWQKLIDLGADMIMTDRPKELLDFLRTNK